MTYLILKAILSAIIIVAVSEVARRSPGIWRRSKRRSTSSLPSATNYLALSVAAGADLPPTAA